MNHFTSKVRLRTYIPRGVSRLYWDSATYIGTLSVYIDNIKPRFRKSAHFWNLNVFLFVQIRDTEDLDSFPYSEIANTELSMWS